MSINYGESYEYRLIKVFWAIGLIALMLLEGYMFGNKYTRRTADELVKINNAVKIDLDEEEIKRKAQECVNAGGLPDYWNDGSWENCDNK